MRGFGRRFVQHHKRLLEGFAEATAFDIAFVLGRWLLFGAAVASAAVVLSTSSTPVHLSPGRSLAGYVDANAGRYGIDPAAALAVSTQEGGSGGIGDFGTSFGPWQLHYGGALPSYVYHGPYSPVTQSWAWSSTGVNYALSHMQGAGCHGLRGYAAVSCIVARFERSARVPAETAGAWAKYALFSGHVVPAPKPKVNRIPRRIRGEVRYVKAHWRLRIVRHSGRAVVFTSRHHNNLGRHRYWAIRAWARHHGEASWGNYRRETVVFLRPR